MVTPKRRAARAHLFIDDWMKELGLTDETLAERIGTNRVTMWRWRTQQNRLNPLKIAAIAGGMGISPEQLWHPPGRQSLDHLLRTADDTTVAKAADLVRVLLRTGT